jgi:hypothetical protein
MKTGIPYERINFKAPVDAAERAAAPKGRAAVPAPPPGAAPAPPPAGH